MKHILTLSMWLATAPLADAQILAPTSPSPPSEEESSRTLSTAARNEAAAEKFLTRNAHAKGVVTTPSGLQYRVLAAGHVAARPLTTNDELTLNYRAKLLNGKIVGSTYAHGAPETLKLNIVIAGLQEGLALMNPGAKWRLFLAPKLGYGDVPQPQIPPGSLLIIDVALIDVNVTPVERWPHRPPKAAPSAPAPSAPNP